MTTNEALKIVLSIAEKHTEPESIIGFNQDKARNQDALRLIRALAEAIV